LYGEENPASSQCSKVPLTRILRLLDVLYEKGVSKEDTQAIKSISTGSSASAKNTLM
jgi:hypothetical protein